MDIEGTMQFILDQQAQFSSDVARIHSILQDVTASQERTSEILATLAERQAERQHETEQTILEVGRTLLDVANAQERTNDILATMADRQIATEETTERLAERQKMSEQISLKLEQSILRGAERHKRTEQTILEVEQTLLDVANAQERSSEILVTLAERQVASEEARLAFEVAFGEARLATEEAIHRLAEKQQMTEENLNVLLLTVERHIANHN